MSRGRKVVLYHILRVLQRCECCNRQPFQVEGESGCWGSLDPLVIRWLSVVMCGYAVWFLEAFCWSYVQHVDLSSNGDLTVILKSATGGLLYAVPGLDFTEIGHCRSTPKLLRHTARMKRCKASSPKVRSENTGCGLRYRFSDPTWRMDLLWFFWMTSIVYSLCTMD